MKISLTIEAKSHLDLVKQLLSFCEGVVETALTKKPGRTAKTPAPLMEKKEEIISEVSAPIEEIEAPVSVPEPQIVAKEVKKEDLQEALQELCDFEDEKAGNKIAGITAVRTVFSRFGVTKLGEVETKKYPEMLAFVQSLLK